MLVQQLSRTALPEVVSDGTICLERLRMTDAVDIVEGEDEDISYWLKDGIVDTLESAAEYVEQAIVMWGLPAVDYAFGIRKVSDDSLVGVIHANADRTYFGDDQINIAYQIFPHARRCGYASRAVALICGFLSLLPTSHEWLIRAHQTNPASMGVAEKNGFILIGSHSDEDGIMNWYSKILTFRQEN